MINQPVRPTKSAKPLATATVTTTTSPAPTIATSSLSAAQLLNELPVAPVPTPLSKPQLKPSDSKLPLPYVLLVHQPIKWPIYPYHISHHMHLQVPPPVHLRHPHWHWIPLHQFLLDAPPHSQLLLHY
jgi:hypothetical protein